jgi:hypothetical protein
MVGINIPYSSHDTCFEKCGVGRGWVNPLCDLYYSTLSWKPV